MARLCIECGKNNIKKYATFGYELKKPIFCKKHKTNDSFNVINKRCILCPYNKPKTPTYGYEWRKPLYCKSHAPNDTKNVVHKRCEYDNCEILATFGTEKSKPRYCKKHSPSNNINVTSLGCCHRNCDKRATFGYVNGHAEYCLEHSENDMVDVMNKQCLHNNCTKRPTFGYVKYKALYCKLHKMNDMTDVLNRRCKESNCNTNPCMGINTVEYCKAHAPIGAKNLVSKKCIIDICNLFAIYGGEKYKPLYCKKHKEENHFLVSKKYCIYKGCKITANFGFDKNKPQYCSKHKLQNMIDVIHKKCNVCWNTQISNSKYEGMCFYCYCHTYPNRKIIRQFRSKQTFIHKNLVNNFKDFEKITIYDKSISGGCSKKRPDWFIECYTHSIIVECDEHQHKRTSKDCEQIRLNNIFIDLAERPLVVIRFNPDSYINKKGEKLPGLFTITKKGRLLISDDSVWIYRFGKLVSKIKYHLLNIPKKGFTINNLFYDEDQKSFHK